MGSYSYSCMIDSAVSYVLVSCVLYTVNTIKKCKAYGFDLTP